MHSHAQAYREHPRTLLAGVVDADPERARAAGELWGVPWGTDVARMCLAARPDVVSVCTPDDTHADVAARLLEIDGPRLLFVEKPLATTAAAARALLASAAARGVTVSVNHTRRFSVAFRTVRDELQAGVHGRPLSMRILYGKGLMHNGVHAIDLVRWWFGEPDRAWGGPAAWGPDGDPTYDVEIRVGDLRARLDGFDDRVASVFELDVLCETGRIRSWRGGNVWEFGRASEGASYRGFREYVPTDRGTRDPVFRWPLADALTRAVGEIVGHLDVGTPMSATGADGLAAVEWVERIRAGS